MNKELVSVIMSVYKESKEELEKSINSILNQSYSNIEFIIVIDNPDEKWRIDFVKSLNDKRINLLVNEKNMGLPKSLNKAIKASKGKYIARMDADDISEENRLEKQFNYLINNNLDLCGSFVKCFYKDKIVKKNSFPITPKGIHLMLYRKNCVAHPSYFLKKELYEKLNGYQNIYTCEDYEFLLRAEKKGYKIGNVPEYLLKYRLTENSISRSNPGKQIMISNYVKKWYKNHSIDIKTSDIENFLSSNYYRKKIKSYDKYWKIRNLRNAKRANLFAYCYYSIISVFFFSIFFNELNTKIMEFYIKKKVI